MQMALPNFLLFGQLKRIVRQWLDECLHCEATPIPAYSFTKHSPTVFCEQITASITQSLVGERPVVAVIDPYNPIGSTKHVSFNTSKTLRWETSPRHCHVNWAMLDGTEGEFCDIVEAHSKVVAYVKNHSLGLEVPYQHRGNQHRYIPDFIVLINDGRGDEDLLQLVVEIKGYRGEQARPRSSRWIRTGCPE